MSKAQMVTFSREDGGASGFLALPDNPKRHRAAIVIHEWWGLNEWAKEMTINLAANGHVALAVDLYDGKVTDNPIEARKLKRSLRSDQVLCCLKAAFDYLARRRDVDVRHIAALGWSLGGGLALQLAIHEPRLAACVVNYGRLPTNLADIKNINAQVLGLFGSKDRGIASEKVRVFQNRMNAANKSFDVKIYDGAGHAFENPCNKAGYRPEAAGDAWSRTLKFLDKAKKSKYPIS